MLRQDEIGSINTFKRKIWAHMEKNKSGWTEQETNRLSELIDQFVSHVIAHYWHDDRYAAAMRQVSTLNNVVDALITPARLSNEVADAYVRVKASKFGMSTMHTALVEYSKIVDQPGRHPAHRATLAKRFTEEKKVLISA